MTSTMRAVFAVSVAGSCWCGPGVVSGPGRLAAEADPELDGLHDEYREPLRVVVVACVHLADDAQVRLVRAGVDHGPGRPVGPAEEVAREDLAVDRNQLEVGIRPQA